MKTVYRSFFFAEKKVSLEKKSRVKFNLLFIDEKSNRSKIFFSNNIKEPHLSL